MQSSLFHNFLLNIITINLKRKEIYISIMECRIIPQSKSWIILKKLFRKKEQLEVFMDTRLSPFFMLNDLKISY